VTSAGYKQRKTALSKYQCRPISKPSTEGGYKASKTVGKPSCYDYYNFFLEHGVTSYAKTAKQTTEDAHSAMLK
jgi:hypothetical protein